MSLPFPSQLSYFCINATDQIRSDQIKLSFIIIGCSCVALQLRLFVVLDTDVDNDQPRAATARGSLEAGVMVFAADSQPLNQPRPTPIVLFERGAAASCSTFVRESSELVIGRNEGLFSFSVDDRGGAAGFEGVKYAVCAAGRFVTRRRAYGNRIYKCFSQIHTSGWTGRKNSAMYSYGLRP